jgi:hypothetical protein
VLADLNIVGRIKDTVMRGGREAAVEILGLDSAANTGHA